MDVVYVKTTLHNIAVQTYNLAMGLQNIAPPQAGTGASLQYLKEISIKLENISKQIDSL